MKQSQKTPEVPSHTAVGAVIGQTGRHDTVGPASDSASDGATDCRRPTAAQNGSVSPTRGHPFHVLLPQYERALRCRALKLSGNEHQAEDLVQATFLKAWAKRDSFTPDTQLQAWLFTILRNTFISNIRKYRREVPDVDGSMAARMYEEPNQEHVISLRELMAAVSTLPGIQRQPLVLMGMLGFSQIEAAEECNCTVGTIKSRVSRARATLVRQIGV